MVAAFLIGFAICCAAQIPMAPPPPGELQPDNSSGLTAQQQKAMAKKLNLQRQQDIKKDTEKLLELATELKQSVDKTTENTLSLDVIKKADEIEKLAKAVKEKMKGP
jgi:hypothetical protein